MRFIKVFTIILDIGRVEAGRYRLIMTVKDHNSAQSAVREGVFRIANR